METHLKKTTLSSDSRCVFSKCIPSFELYKDCSPVCNLSLLKHDLPIKLQKQKPESQKSYSFPIDSAGSYLWQRFMYVLSCAFTDVQQRLFADITVYMYVFGLLCVLLTAF